MRENQSPREKYMNDPEYHHLVHTLEGLIESARFTPSELREACVLASINYEMRHIRGIRIDPQLQEALQVLDEYTSKSTRRR
jgi:hypothetical protein